MWVFCKEDGTQVKTAYLDGYHFGDRLLEGVMFRITINEDHTFNAEPVDDPTKGYLAGLNMPYWIEAAASYAAQNDLFQEHSDGSGEDLFVIDTETGEECPNCA